MCHLIASGSNHFCGGLLRLLRFSACSYLRDETKAMINITSFQSRYKQKTFRWKRIKFKKSTTVPLQKDSLISSIAKHSLNLSFFSLVPLSGGGLRPPQGANDATLNKMGTVSIKVSKLERTNRQTLEFYCISINNQSQ